jgi:hypothetical protein
MEVFVGYTADAEFQRLSLTLDCWDACGFEVAAIECKADKYEIARRVAADNLATEPHYILADLGCVLQERKSGAVIRERLTGVGDPCKIHASENTRMVGLMPDYGMELACDIVGGCCGEYCPFCSQLKQLRAAPIGVRIIRKGSVQKWLPKTTESYDQEHAESIRMSAGETWCPGMKAIEIWPDIFFRHLPVH